MEREEKLVALFNGQLSVVKINRSLAAQNDAYARETRIDYRNRAETSAREKEKYLSVQGPIR